MDMEIHELDIKRNVHFYKRNSDIKYEECLHLNNVHEKAADRLIAGGDAESYTAAAMLNWASTGKINGGR